MIEDWRPSAGIDALRERAAILGRIRAFFARREVLEVTTPVMGRTGPPDGQLSLVEAAFPGLDTRYFLQPSPESAMKRLLAAGSGPIYQLGPCFRAGERGPRHNPEFTMLEWYRPGFSLDDLSDEVDALLAEVLGTSPARRLCYRDAFHAHVGLDPFDAADVDLLRAARDAGLQGDGELDRDALLDMLFATRVEPALGPGAVQISDFPASQAAMAQVDGPVAKRVEVYVDGMELANGYQELTDPGEQRRRFLDALDARRRRGDPELALDEPLLQALESGLPASAGMALGVDRLVMLSLGHDRVDQVIAFPLERC